MPAKEISGRNFEEVTIREIASSVDVLQGLNIPPHDFISLGYTGNDLTSVVYKSGGSGGTVVATLALTYDGGGNLTSVTRT